MDIKKALIEATNETMSMFGLTPVFQNEIKERDLSSHNPVNILIGFTNGLKGNVVVGLKEHVALQLASSMMGGMEVKELDFMSKSALTELTNMIVGAAFIRLKTSEIIHLAPPTLITGKELSLMISKVNSSRLTFNLEDNPFEISFAVENI